MQNQWLLRISCKASETHILDDNFPTFIFSSLCSSAAFYEKKCNYTNLIRKIICATSFISSTFVRISEYCSAAAHSTVSKVSCTRTNICRWLKNISFFLDNHSFQLPHTFISFAHIFFLFIFSKNFD